MLISDLRRDFFRTRLARLDADDRAARSTRWSREAEDRARRAVRRARASRATGALVRFGQLPLREPGAQRRGAAAGRRRSSAEAMRRDRERLPRRLRARVHLPARRAGRVRRGPLVAKAEVGKLEPAPLPVTGAALGDARRARATSTSTLEGVHGADVYDGERWSRECGSTARRSSRRRATTVVVHPGNRARSTIRQPPHRAGGRHDATARVRPDHARDHPELPAGRQRRDVRRDAQDRDERDHLRGARHGHRHHRRRRAAGVVRRGDPGLRRRARQGRPADPRAQPARADRATATSSPPTTRSTAASPTSTTSCWRCRCSPTAS